MTGKFEDIGWSIGRLVDKNPTAHHRSFSIGAILAIFYPGGIRMDQYDDLAAMIRILDKFFQIATNKTTPGEDPWQDIAGYAILMNKNMEIEA